MANFLGALVFLALVANGLTASVGEKCNKQGDCDGSNVQCSIASPTCGQGTCSCVPGFVYHKEGGSCKRSVTLGGSCGMDDWCVAENAECDGSSCRCKDNFKVGPRGDDCVSSMKNVSYDGTCHDSVECHYNMVCLLNRCTCYTGYKQVGVFLCDVRGLGDACSESKDCARTPNAECQGGKCSCRGGFKQVAYRKENAETGWSCIGDSENPGGEGDSCDADAGKVCQRPYTCISCDKNSDKKCTQPRIYYANAITPTATVATTLIIAVSTWIL